ncbi:DUF4124 domain-containing protein [Marinicella meishanensis]|uniref:DUF4124 domain-containing protein n=1 Tax=Marinicella meishanensis TaxID=2873263 RepID=UPI001CBB29BC|nr:DUF4124 domain-containing protein [Marinicella sp. NBU2979]
MNKTHLLLAAWLLSTGAQAKEEKKIYKYTDENGVTHYTETKPNDNYEEADLPELSVVPARPADTYSNTTTSDAEPVDPAEVPKFEILEPSQEQNLWGTGGKVTVSVPELTEAQSFRYQVQVVLDGEKQKPDDSSSQTFSNISRGEHQVQALLVERLTNKVKKKSQVVTFFMHQNSKK